MHPVKKAWLVLREQGPRALALKVAQRFGRKMTETLPPVSGSVKIGFLAKTDDVAAVDWTHPHPAVADPITVGEGPLTFAWIMSPPGESSGGHQNIFRFIDYLERAGHRCKIYIYSAHSPYTLPVLRTMLAESPSYADVSATLEDWTGGVSDDVDAIFATGWETTYPSFRDTSRARRLYFVQDFEPYFYAVGSEYALAENTYRFGFHGVTAGGFLSHKVSTDYGMPADHFDFGADKSVYNVTETGDRREVFFYARPVTTRRGFELGVLALEHFAKSRPDYRINLAGWDVSGYDIPFEYENLRDLKIDQLNEIYNRCATGLVISLTNMSLLPLELLAAGVIPVVNDGPNNRLVSDNPYIEYAAAAPHALGQRMIDVVDRIDLREHSRLASESVATANWDTSGAQFVSIVERAVRGS